jgi:hypothetical protein
LGAVVAATGGRTTQPSSISSGSGRTEEDAMAVASGAGGFLAGEGLRAGQYMFVCSTLPAIAQGCTPCCRSQSTGGAVRVPEAGRNFNSTLSATDSEA